MSALTFQILNYSLGRFLIQSRYIFLNATDRNGDSRLIIWTRMNNLRKFTRESVRIYFMTLEYKVTYCKSCKAVDQAFVISCSSLHTWGKSIRECISENWSIIDVLCLLLNAIFHILTLPRVVSINCMRPTKVNIWFYTISLNKKNVAGLIGILQNIK